DGRVVAELLPAESGGVAVSARDGLTGRELWRHRVPPPEAADWAETTPAWAGAQTEDIYAFLADDPDHLVACLMRESRRTETHLMPVPPYACQTDAIRFGPLSGEVVWRGTFAGVGVPLIKQESFTGLWSREGRVGRIDFASGANTVLHESP